MTTEEAVRFFVTQTRLGQAIGIRQASVAGWGEYPPPLRQLQIERVTRGQLRAEPECDAYRPMPVEQPNAPTMPSAA